MNIRRILHADFQQPLVIACLAVISGHLILSALFYMEAGIGERLAWAALAGLGLGYVGLNYGRFRPSVRGFLCFGIGIMATIFGLGIHISHVYQAGVATADVTGLPVAFAGLFLAVLGGTILVRLVHDWWRRVLLVPPGIVFVFFVIFPIGLGVFATNVAHVPCCDETPADYGFLYEDVTFETPAGLTLSAWYVPSRNGATIITVHGAGSNREKVMGEAMLLARHDYGLLMIDIEGFGASEGRSNAFGWVGARDVHAAVEYLKSRTDVDQDRIGGLGLSMGGEVLLHAAGESDGLKAVVAEGATGRTARDFREMNEFDYDTTVSAIHNVAGFTMSMISGEEAPPPLKQMVEQIAPRRVLLIAASVREEEKLMGLYKDIGGDAFDLWVIPEPKHVGSFILHPEEYEQRVIAFFDDALLRHEVAGASGVR